MDRDNKTERIPIDDLPLDLLPLGVKNGSILENLHHRTKNEQASLNCFPKEVETICELTADDAPMTSMQCSKNTDHFVSNTDRFPQPKTGDAATNPSSNGAHNEPKIQKSRTGNFSEHQVPQKSCLRRLILPAVQCAASCKTDLQNFVHFPSDSQLEEHFAYSDVSSPASQDTVDLEDIFSEEEINGVYVSKNAPPSLKKLLLAKLFNPVGSESENSSGLGLEPKTNSVHGTIEVSKSNSCCGTNRLVLVGGDEILKAAESSSRCKEKVFESSDDKSESVSDEYCPSHSTDPTRFSAMNHVASGVLGQTSGAKVCELNGLKQGEDMIEDSEICLKTFQEGHGEEFNTEVENCPSVSSSDGSAKPCFKESDGCKALVENVGGLCGEKSKTEIQGFCVRVDEEGLITSPVMGDKVIPTIDCGTKFIDSSENEGTVVSSESVELRNLVRNEVGDSPENEGTVGTRCEFKEISCSSEVEQSCIEREVECLISEIVDCVVNSFKDKALHPESKGVPEKSNLSPRNVNENICMISAEKDREFGLVTEGEKDVVSIARLQEVNTDHAVKSSIKSSEVQATELSPRKRPIPEETDGPPEKQQKVYPCCSNDASSNIDRLKLPEDELETYDLGLDKEVYGLNDFKIEASSSCEEMDSIHEFQKSTSALEVMEKDGEESKIENGKVGHCEGVVDSMEKYQLAAEDDFLLESQSSKESEPLPCDSKEAKHTEGRVADEPSQEPLCNCVHCKKSPAVTPSVRVVEVPVLSMLGEPFTDLVKIESEDPVHDISVDDVEGGHSERVRVLQVVPGVLLPEDIEAEDVTVEDSINVEASLPGSERKEMTANPDATVPEMHTGPEIHSDVNHHELQPVSSCVRFSIDVRKSRKHLNPYVPEDISYSPLSNTSESNLCGSQDMFSIAEPDGVCSEDGPEDRLPNGETKSNFGHTSNIFETSDSKQVKVRENLVLETEARKLPKGYPGFMPASQASSVLGDLSQKSDVPDPAAELPKEEESVEIVRSQTECSPPRKRLIDADDHGPPGKLAKMDDVDGLEVVHPEVAAADQQVPGEDLGGEMENNCGTPEEPKLYTCDADILDEKDSPLCLTVDEYVQKKMGSSQREVLEEEPEICDKSIVEVHSVPTQWRSAYSWKQDVEPAEKKPSGAEIYNLPVMPLPQAQAARVPLRIGLSRRQTVKPLHPKWKRN